MKTKFEAISYSLPANPSRYRVATWKALREIGAVYLQAGVAMVPEKADLHGRLEELRKNILSWNGRASLLTLTFDREEDEQEALDSFSTARQEEYEGIREDAARLLSQLEKEKKSAGKTPDMDKYVLELRRLRRRMETAQGHDFFGADKSAAEQALLELAALLPGDEKPARPRRSRPSGTPAPRPVPTALETAEKLLEQEQKQDEEDDGEMPVFLF